MMQARIRSRWTSVAVAAFSLALCVGAAPSSAGSAAALAAPTGLGASPAGSSTPILTWASTKGATSYQVQVDDDPGFGSPEFAITTTNFRATPLAALKAGTNRWRVRATSGSTSSTWATGSFDVSPVHVPVPVSPANGAILPQPENPPLLQWHGSPGALSYTVEVDADQDFVGAKSYSTKTTSLVVPDPMGGGDWFWRVTAVKAQGLVSIPSPAASFVVGALPAPQLTYPRDDINAAIEDVVLDWLPVPGARTYDIQVALDEGFNNIAASATNVQGTRYSPVVTLNNDQFWWRVRAVDLGGQPTEWTASRFSFQRQWPQQPQPVFPLGSPTAPSTQTTTAPFYQWTPVPHASHYELITASDVNFSSNVLICNVAGTTHAPRDTNNCGFKLSGTTFWKVRPKDLPYPTSGGLPGVYSDTQAFTWTGWADPGPLVTEFQPVTGQRVSIGGVGGGCTADLCDAVPTTPVLSWDPQPGITSYQVYIAQDENFTTSVLAPKIPVTRNTTFALQLPNIDTAGTLPESQAGGAYYWYVRPCSGTLCGPSPVSTPAQLPGTKIFRKASPPVTGLTASNPAGTEITFSWHDYYATNIAHGWNGETGVQSAKTYKIQVDNEPSFAAPLLDERIVDQATYTAFERLYPEGTIHWRVQARDYQDNGLTWSAPQTLIKKSPDVVLSSPVGGRALPGTTPFQWEAQPFAASYTIEVYRNNDVSFSLANRVFSATVKTTAYAWNQPIPASGTPYVWRVRRTDAEGNPGPWSPAASFRSLGAAPTLIAPAAGSRQPGNAPLLTWTDSPGAASYTLNVQSPTGSVAKVSTVGNAVALTKTVPTGSYTWTVTAIDPAGNSLGESTSRSFTVDSTPPTVLKLAPKRIKPKTTLKIVFDEPVKGISKKTIKLKKQTTKGYKAVKVGVKSAKGGKVAVVNPKSRLKKGSYKVLLSSSLKDAAGNPLAKTTLTPKVG